MFSTIEQVKRANEDAGFHFFDMHSMRFFKCRVNPTIYKGRYFVTSEKGPDNVRRYTVREVLINGAIDTVGEFQGFKTSKSAHNAASKL